MTRHHYLVGASALAVLMAGAPLTALAQTQTAPDAVEEIVVTGSRIPQPNMSSISPVTQITSQDIKAQGVTRVEDMINALPQAFAAQGANISNGASGTATVSLRGLGSARTLVLIDGRRMTPGSPIAPAADLNFIPSSLVSRVEVNTGGASAVYGSDAVAGVVNFIMQRDFEGLRIDAQYSGYQHNNENVTAKNANSAKGFSLPDGTVWDGEGAEISLVFGANAADGKGNITAYATYREITEVMQGNRDYSACTFNSGDVFTCGGSGTSDPARVGSFVVDGNTFRTRTSADVYNYGPTNYYQRPDKRVTLGAFSHYQVTPWLEAYSDLMFMDDHSVAQIAPGGIFAGYYNVNCNNPLMTAAQQSQLCGADAGTSTLKNVIVARRNTEGGGRQNDIRHTSYRAVVGGRGALGDNWTYDAYAQYGTTSYTSSTLNYFMTDRIQEALLVDPTTGQCTSGNSACVPYNIFSEGGVTQAALDYLQVAGSEKGTTSQHVANFTVTGLLGDYGVQSPWASDGVGVALGVEYRRESLSYQADYLLTQGLLSGTGGASPPVNGSFNVAEIYGEARIPLVQDKTLVKDLQLELGYRYSDYSTVGGTDTYKLGVDYSPISDVRFRASYNRAVRAPNILELYSAQSVSLDGTTDPCAGLSATSALVATCATAFGLTTAQVLAIEPNSAAQYNGLTGGNPDLAPETSDTYSYGFVLRPSLIHGLSLSADYFHIKVEDYISTVGADTIISRCLDTLDNKYCGLVHRDSDGSLWLSSDGYVVDTTLNTGSLDTSGVDFELNYATDLETLGLAGWGRGSVNFVGTWLDALKTKPLPEDAAYDCAGYYGTQCGTPNPEWRHKLRTTWTTPWSDLAISAQWRYIGGVDVDASSSDPTLYNEDLIFETDKRLKSRSYIDLSTSFSVRDVYKVNIGVNNVFDIDPPLVGGSNCPSGSCNGNTYAQVYDTLGRYGFLRLSREF